MTDVAIIGAGPYGLSVGAYLGEAGVDCQVIGRPMDTWITQMPRDMRLKSEGFASTLYDPQSNFTLGRYCSERAIPYADVGLPVHIQTFVDYGLAFQRAFIPNAENQLVTSIAQRSSGFRLELEDGRELFARKVVVAAGIGHFQFIPPCLSGLSPDLVSHTSSRATYGQFRGRHVAVIGGGASAIDVAATLLKEGANVQVLSRKPIVRFHSPPGPLPRPLIDRVRAPMTGLGPGWKSWLCTHWPLLFYQMPGSFRTFAVRKHLGPAAGWFVKDQVDGRVVLHTGMTIQNAAPNGSRVRLYLSDAQGERAMTFDHVIAGTGYRVALTRLAFISSELRSKIRTIDDAPVLSRSFESSVRGMYFVGASSANSFGPLVRFAYGAKFTAARLTKHFVRQTTSDCSAVNAPRKRVNFARRSS